MVGNINDRQNDNATTAATPATFGEDIAKMQSTTASAPRTVSTFVARTRPITHVMMNREMRKTIKLICRRKPPNCSDPCRACCEYWIRYVHVQTWAATLKNCATTPK